MDYQKILEVCEKATPGPWGAYDQEIWQMIEQSIGLRYPIIASAYEPRKQWFSSADAEFIALTRTALPELVQRCFLLEEVLQQTMTDIEEGLDADQIIDDIKCKVPEIACIEGTDYVTVKQSELKALEKVAEAAKEITSSVPLSPKEGRPDYASMITSDKIHALRQALADLEEGASE